MDIIVFVIVSLYCMAGAPIYAISFGGNYHANCKHDYKSVYDHSYMVGYLFHGIVWYDTRENLIFAFSLCVYLCLNFNYICQGSFRVHNVTIRLLFISLGIHAIVLYIQYETFIGCVSLLIQIISLSCVSKLHNQCYDTV